MEKRRYFSSNEEEYKFPEVPVQSYLYIYKHNFPEIIVRFPQPLKTITGYRLYCVQIFYHPFYEQSNHDQSRDHYKSRESHQIEKLELQYQGQIILSLESSIFNTYFQQEVLNLLQQQAQPNKPNKKHSKKLYKKQNHQHSFHLGPNIYTQNNHQSSPMVQKQPSQMFKIFLTQWLKDPEITTMFYLSQKHMKTFHFYDHGYMKVQILKTSDKTMKVPFHHYMQQRQWTQQQISNYQKTYQNKIYYFQYEIYILSTYHQNFQDAQKLGFVIPNPITTNQFFYQVLLNMFNEFEAGQQEKQNRKKRKYERLKMREALLENLRKIGVQGDVPELNHSEEDDQQPKHKDDELDKILQQLFSKNKYNKNQHKNLSYMKGEPSFTEQHLSSIHNHNQSYLENSPRRRLSTKLSDMREEEHKKEEELSKRYRSPTISNVKVIKSFTSELLEDDFEQKSKRRFITKKQYVKILEFNKRLTEKKKQKERKIHQEHNRIHVSPEKQKQQVVFVGLREHKNNAKPHNKKGQFRGANTTRYAYDYFGVYEDTIIIDEQPLRRPMQYSWEEKQIDSVMDQHDSYGQQQQGQELNIQEFISPSQNLSAGYQRQDCTSINSNFMYEVEKQLDNGKIVYYARY